MELPDGRLRRRHRLVYVIYVNDIKIDTSVSRVVVIVNRVLAGICLFVSDDVNLPGF